MTKETDQLEWVENRFGNRLELAQYALRICEREILTKETFAPEEKQQLACSYIFYRSELLCVGRILTMVKQEAGEDIPFDYDHFRTESTKILTAIMDARAGYYIGVKRYLNGYCSQLSGPLTRDQERLIRVLTHFVVTMPDTGKPFVSPSHPWEDPRVINSWRQEQARKATI